jgi:hypothetical protein
VSRLLRQGFTEIYFRKYGLDVTLVQVRNGPLGMAALSSGESLMHWGSVSATNLGGNRRRSRLPRPLREKNLSGADGARNVIRLLGATMKRSAD